MPTPMLTGLPRVLTSAVGSGGWSAVPGWEKRSGFDGGYREIYGAVVHTTETRDSTFAAGGDAPTLAHVADLDGSRGAHTYALLIGRGGRVYLIGAGPGWQAGKGTWPTKVAGKNPGVNEDMANLHTIGVSMDANASQYPPTQAQLESLVKVLKALRQEWSPDRFEIMMHGEWQPVGHPGAEGRTDPTGVPDGWDAIRKAVAAGAWPAAPKPAKPAATGTRTYTVQAGDTLTSIAQAHGTDWRTLAETNRLPNPNALNIGQVLALPTPATYVVARGEGLWSIAVKHGMALEALCKMNGLAADSVIHPGQVLEVAA